MNILYGMIQGMFVKMMYEILQFDEPDDYVCATGNEFKVSDFADLVFNELGLKSHEHIIWNDPRYVRPNELNYLCGCSDKLQDKLKSVGRSFKLRSLAFLIADMINGGMGIYER